MADDGHDTDLPATAGPGSDDHHELSAESRRWLRELGAAPVALPARRRPPLWPVLAGLLTIVAIAAAMTLGLARSGAVTIFGAPTGDTESSLNWAGYLASHGRFTSVSATWTVPAVRATSDPSATASFWVGLDGRDSRSLQQIGTTSGMMGGAPYYGVWWEMLPGPAVDVPLTIAPGDTVTASVVADGRGDLHPELARRHERPPVLDQAGRRGGGAFVGRGRSRGADVDERTAAARGLRRGAVRRRAGERPSSRRVRLEQGEHDGRPEQAGHDVGPHAGGSRFTVVWNRP